MDSDEVGRIVAWGASGRLSRWEVIARLTMLWLTSSTSTTLNLHSDTSQSVGQFDSPPWTVADGRRTG